MTLKGKMAVVTGAGGGIGSGLVKRLKKEEVKLILIEKDLSLFEHLADVLDGPNIKKMEADLSKPEEIVKVCEEIKKGTDKVDFLFNVAGIGIYKPIEELTLEEWQSSMNINVTAAFLLSKELMPLLKKSNDSLIVNIGSGMGVMALPNRAAYCSSKFALRGLSLTLSREYKDRNIGVILMTLGSIMTPFGPGGLEKRKELQKKGKKYFTPEQVVEKIINTLNDPNRPEEVVYYPEDYEKKNK